MKIAYSKAATKALSRMPADRAERIRAKIREYAAMPATQANNVQKMLGREGYRLRVGDWRVIFILDGDIMRIVAVGPRGGIYER